ncbi:hypothetical protein CWI36_0482p0010 [Hamiltosporidium magnivora]|uniref:Uncharacterized protein n=1 Tax=Hamiltosporidium magnivora TaxID=148818 RepID=A0A4Q9LF56_9MICR|nr:hypothetical protein CWI36_0482p0010 [Hamiltosporidium magnivora]
MIILNFSRYIIFLNVFNVILTTVSDSLQVLKKTNIKEKPDQVLMKNITEDKEKDSTDSKIRENSEKENPSLDENNKKTVKLGNIFNLRRDSDSKNNKSSTVKHTNNSSKTKKGISFIFVNSLDNPKNIFNENMPRFKNAHSFNPLEWQKSRGNGSSLNMNPRSINQPYNQNVYCQSFQQHKLYNETKRLFSILNRIYFYKVFTHLKDLLPLLQYNYLFNSITNTDTLYVHCRTFENISFNEIKIKKDTNITKEELQKNWELFDRKYSEINITDYNYPLLSLIPGISMLKEFIYKLLSNKSLEERNIFNIFVGMKMLESILVFSREIIFVLNPNHKIDIFNCDRRVKNILIEHKKIFFAILKILLAKNFCLSKEFFTNLRIIEIGCVCFLKNRQYWANEYHFYFLRALIDSIFLVDEELLNIVHGVFSDYVLNVSCHTGFVSLKRLNFFEIGKFKIAPQMAMKFIRYYLRMLNKKEFIMCRDLNEMIFRDIIGALTNEADIIEKNGSTQENEHMDLLFRCISTFHFIIKFGFNRDIHDHYHLKMLSEYIVLR